MEFDRTGIILFTLKYQECLHFYGEVLGLKKMFETETLASFEFGNAYLMVEIGQESKGQLDVSNRNHISLRMNVSDVKSLADQLTSQGIAVDYEEHSWGTVAKFKDPDGNLCEFKDSAGFEKQIDDHPISN